MANKAAMNTVGPTPTWLRISFGWAAIMLLFGGATLACRARLHLIQPGWFVVVSLASSLAFILVMWLIYRSMETGR